MLKSLHRVRRVGPPEGRPVAASTFSTQRLLSVRGGGSNLAYTSSLSDSQATSLMYSAVGARRGVHWPFSVENASIQKAGNLPGLANTAARRLSCGDHTVLFIEALLRPSK